MGPHWFDRLNESGSPLLPGAAHFKPGGFHGRARSGPADVMTSTPHERNVAMRRRAYRPEVPGCLEDRALLSGVAGLSADPVVLPLRRLNRVAEHMRFSFGDFARFRVISLLRDELRNETMPIP